MLNATVYNGDTLNMFAKITPRFIFLSSAQDSIDKEIIMCVLSDEIDSKKVLNFIGHIENQYSHGIKSMPIHIINTSYKNLQSKKSKSCEKAQLIFLFNSSDENINDVVNYAKIHTILTASYDVALLEKGVDISLFIGRRIVPYINTESIKDKGITLNHLILRLSKIFTMRSKKH